MFLGACCGTPTYEKSPDDVDTHWLGCRSTGCDRFCLSAFATVTTHVKLLGFGSVARLSMQANERNPANRPP